MQKNLKHKISHQRQVNLNHIRSILIKVIYIRSYSSYCMYIKLTKDCVNADTPIE